MKDESKSIFKMNISKNIMVGIIPLAIVAIVLLACNKERVLNTTKEVVTGEYETNFNAESISRMESMVDSIMCGDDLWRVLDSCSLIMSKCIETSTQIQFLDVDNVDFCNRIGMSSARYESINNYISSTMDSIAIRYPELLNFASNYSNCVYCDEGDPSEKIQSIIQYFKLNSNTSYDLREIVDYSHSGNQGYSSNNTGCDNYFNYTMCLLVCAATGPVVYWICAYLCLCEYCPVFCVSF